MKHLSQNTKLYAMAFNEFMKIANKATVRAVEIMGDASIKVHYRDEDGEDTWCIDIIHLIQKKLK